MFSLTFFITNVQCCRHGKLKPLIRLLEASSDLNVRDLDNKSLLHVALEKWYEMHHQCSLGSSSGSIRATSSASSVGIRSPTTSFNGSSAVPPSSSYSNSSTSIVNDDLVDRATICRLLLSHNAENYFDAIYDKNVYLYLDEFLLLEEEAKRKLPYDSVYGGSTPPSSKRMK